MGYYITGNDGKTHWVGDGAPAGSNIDVDWDGNQTPPKPQAGAETGLGGIDFTSLGSGTGGVSGNSGAGGSQTFFENYMVGGSAPNAVGYGGAPGLAGAYLQRDQAAQQQGSAMANRGVSAAEQAAYAMMIDSGQLREGLQGQAQQAQSQYAGLQNQALANQGAASVQARDYGASADAQFGNYGGMRSSAANMGQAMANAGERGAGQLERYAQGAAGEYQSAADAAFRGATDANLRSSLSLAARGGQADMREALANQAVAGQQAALQQQATRAQEANQLNQMRNDAVAQAAGLRQQGYGGAAGVSTQLGGLDQQAAQLQAQRQQQAQALGLSYYGAQADAANAGNAYQLQNAGLQGSLIGSNAQAQNAAAGAAIQAGQNQQNMYLNAETQQNSAQLGADMMTEAQRQEYERSISGSSKADAAYKGFGKIIDPGGLIFG